MPRRAATARLIIAVHAHSAISSMRRGHKGRPFSEFIIASRHQPLVRRRAQTTGLIPEVARPDDLSRGKPCVGSNTPGIGNREDLGRLLGGFFPMQDAVAARLVAERRLGRPAPSQPRSQFGPRLRGLLAESDLTPTPERRHRTHGDASPFGNISSGGKYRQLLGGVAGTIQSRVDSLRSGRFNSRWLFAEYLRSYAAIYTGPPGSRPGRRCAADRDRRGPPRLLPVQNIRPDAVGDACRRRLERFTRQVCVSRSRVDLVVAQELPDHRKRLAERQRSACKGVPEAVVHDNAARSTYSG